VAATPPAPATLPPAAGGGRAPPDAREAASQALGRAFKGAIAAVRRLRGRDTHRPGEIAHAQYALLFELAERGELAAGELAAAAELAPATVTGMLDHLADAGLVVRARSESDRRIVVTRLTESGRARVTERHARVAPLWNAALAEFEPGDLLVAAAVLDRLGRVFESLDASCAAGADGAGAAPPAAT
jgi:DNA-binding MarR family transcriptional regulator